MTVSVTCSDGIRLFVDDQGPRHAATIVFAHEFGGDWRTWDGLISHLAMEFRCVRYAARGFSPSDTPEDLHVYGQERSTEDLAEVVDRLGLDRFHLVGCSMGSFTSLMFALEAPDRLRCLTLIGCSSGPRDDAERARYRAALGEELGLLRRLGGDGAVQWFSSDPAYRRMLQKAPEVWRAYLERLRRQSVQGAVQTLKTVHWNRRSLFDLERQLQALRVPTNLIYGEEDHPLVLPTNSFLSEVLPCSQEVKVPTTGHLVHLEEEQSVLELLSAMRWA